MKICNWLVGYFFYVDRILELFLLEFKFCINYVYINEEDIFGFQDFLWLRLNMV